MPTFDELKSLSASLYHDHAQLTGISETTPESITPAVASFCREIGAERPEVVPVVHDPYGLYGWCSDGVREKVRHDGGDIRFGWTIWEFPRLFLTAEFHAVWIDANGKFLDITPKPQGETSIVFAPDGGYSRIFDFDQRPVSRRRRIYAPPSPSTEDVIARMGAAQLRYEGSRASKAGMSLNQWISAKQPVDPLAQAVDDFVSVCAAHDAKMDSFERPVFKPDKELLDLIACNSAPRRPHPSQRARSRSTDDGAASPNRIANGATGTADLCRQRGHSNQNQRVTPHSSSASVACGIACLIFRMGGLRSMVQRPTIRACAASLWVEAAKRPRLHLVPDG